MTEKRIKIGIDARLSGQKNAGLGRYIENLLLRLPFLTDGTVELVYFFADKTQWSEILAQMGTLELAQDKKVAEVLKKIKVVYAPVHHYSLAEQTTWLKILRAENLDLLHVPHFNAPYFYGGKMVVTIHDLLWHERKGMQATTLAWWKYYLKYFGYRLLTKRVVKNASKIITVSRTVKKTLSKYYPQVKKKIQVIYNGVDKRPLMPPLAERGTERTSDDAIELLYVASLYPHKNVELILRALQRKPQWRLTIVSARNVFWQRLSGKIAELNVGAQVKFLGRVSEAKLQSLYQEATVLVQPSFSEGFGLTGVEALRAGTGVAASKIEVFQEVYGEAFMPFDPQKESELITAVQKAARAKTEKWWQKVAATVVGQYSWEKMARETVAVYQEVLQPK